MESEYRCRGVVLHWDAKSRTWYYKPVALDEYAETWGVYKVDEDGITDSWVADFLTKELAHQYIGFLLQSKSN